MHNTASMPAVAGTLHNSDYAMPPGKAADRWPKLTRQSFLLSRSKGVYQDGLGVTCRANTA